MPTPLSETDSYMIFADGKDIFLFDKDINEVVWRVNIGERATCAWIDLSNDWALIFGERLYLWKNEKITMLENGLKNICDFRQIEDNIVLILTHPTKKEGAIWSFDIITEQLMKIRDFYQPDFIKNSTSDWFVNID